MPIRRRTLLAASAATALAGPALAQNYPRRAVQLIVAFPAGGSTDVGARILASLAEKELGQTITVVNKAGAGGQIGFTDIARARPDGYTLGFLNLPGLNTIILDPERKAEFNIDSFIPVVNQVLDPGLIHVTEHWADQASLAAHGASPHIREWRATWPGLGIGARDLTLFEAGAGRPI